MIAIIGGGISGLAAAYELSRRNRSFVLLEASPRLGGLIHTHREAGFTLEAGADSMLAQKPAALELCRELGLGDRLLTMRTPRTAFVLAGTRLHALPSPSLLGIPATWRGLASYSLLTPGQRARLALEPLVPRRTETTDEPIASFFRRRFGAASVGLIAEPLLGGIHAGRIERLSLEGLFPRLAEAERTGGSILRWIGRTAGRGDGAGAFRSLRGGMSDLVEGLRAALPPGSIRTDAPVTALHRVDGRWQVEVAGERLGCDAVLLACPAPAAAALLAPIDSEAADLCRQTPYVSTISLGLAWPRRAVAHPLAGSGFVVARARSSCRLTACTWVSSKWDHRAPDDTVLLRAYAGGAHDPAVVEMTDDEIVAMAVGELSAILSITGSPMLARVFRWRNAGAQHEVGHRARVATLEDRLARQPGLFITGSGFRSIGIPDCVADGRQAAARAETFSHAN